jgi:predicted urease superfamily metal-dependent hydrolase
MLFTTRIALFRALIQHPHMLHEITDEEPEEARERLEHEFELAEKLMREGY